MPTVTKTNDKAALLDLLNRLRLTVERDPRGKWLVQTPVWNDVRRELWEDR